MIKTNVNNVQKKVNQIKTKVNGSMVNIGKIMTKVNGTMKCIYEKKSYTELQYLASSRIQYIDTGYKQKNTTIIECEMQAEEQYGYAFGSGIYQSYVNLGITVENQFAVCSRNGSSSNVSKGTGIAYTSGFHTFKVGQTVGINVDNAYITNLPQYAFSSNSNLFFFGWNGGSGLVSTEASAVAIKKFRILEGNVLIKEFIPVKDNNGVACMYDNVSKTFFYNQGSGVFITNEQVSVTYKDGDSIIDTETYRYGEKAVQPEKPSKSGYFFNGWKLNETTYDFNTQLTGNIVLQADFKKIEYTELEYIRSSGTQYINTGYIHKSNTKIEMDCIISSSYVADYASPFGARKNDYRYNAMSLFTRFGASNIPCYTRSNKEQTGSNMIYNTKIKIIAEGQTCTWTDGTNTYNVTTSGTADNGANSMFLFNLNTAGQGASSPDISYCIMDLYSCKIYEGTELKMHIISVKDNSNVVCMYDKVSNTYYYNQGSGSFIPGPVK